MLDKSAEEMCSTATKAFGRSPAVGHGVGGGVERKRRTGCIGENTESAWGRLNDVESPVNCFPQECNEFTYQFAEEIRRQSFGAATPGYDFMARLRYVCKYIVHSPLSAERVEAVLSPLFLDRG